MLTTQTNIALQIVATLSSDELAAFNAEFVKIWKPQPTIKPKKTITDNLPSVAVLKKQVLERHRANFKIPRCNKLA